MNCWNEVSYTQTTFLTSCNGSSVAGDGVQHWHRTWSQNGVNIQAVTVKAFRKYMGTMLSSTPFNDQH